MALNDNLQQMTVQHPMHAMIAPIGPPPPPMDLSGMSPQTLPAMKDTQTPDVNSKIRVKMSPLDDYENAVQSKLMSDMNAPAQKYHGVGGKILHGLNVARNLAEDFFVPQMAVMDPTSYLHRQFMDKNYGNTIQNVEKEKAEENLQDAQAGAIPSEESLREAQTENLRNPPATPIETAGGYFSYNPRTQATAPITGPNGQPLQPYVKPGPQQHVVLQGPDGKPMLGFVDPQTGVTRDAQGAPIENPIPFEKPTAPQHITVMKDGQPHVMGADADGNFTRDLGIAPPNYAQIAPELKTYQTKDESGQNVTKTLSGKTLGLLPDTTTQRNMAEMAATVQPQMESVINEVEQLANAVGPAVGRWNELMVNKGGADYPQFAGLDTDLDLLASAIVRTHFGARGGQEYRQELRRMFGAAQSPQDLVNRIEHAEGWIEGYAASGGAKTPTGHAYQGGAGGAQPIVQMNKKTGAYRYSTDGGQTWQNGQPPSR